LKKIGLGLESLVAVVERIGLHLNTTKCEIIHASEYLLTFHLLESFVHLSPPNALLFSAPLFNGSALDTALLDCCEDLTKATDKLQSSQFS
jgi:hypothetical protein